MSVQRWCVASPPEPLHACQGMNEVFVVHQVVHEVSSLRNHNSSACERHHTTAEALA